MNSQKIKCLLVLMMILLASCNLPKGTQSPQALTATETATPITPEIESPTITCNPSITTTTVANIRSGPGLGYGVIGSLPLGGTAKVAGKNTDASWWYIEFAGGSNGYAWIADSVTSETCIPQTLAVIAAPPLPVAQQPSSNSGNNSSGDNSSSGNSNNSAPTAAPLLLLPVAPLLQADVFIQEIFLSNEKQIVVRIGVDPASLRGDIQIKVFVSGNLQATINDEIWTSSALYYSGVTLTNTKLVQVNIDTANNFNESNESNNSWNVACIVDTLECG